MKLDKLLSPGKIGTLELKNRFVVPPVQTLIMVTAWAEKRSSLFAGLPSISVVSKNTLTTHLRITSAPAHQGSCCLVSLTA